MLSVRSGRQVFAAAILLVAAGAARATDLYWVGPNNGSWSDPANWSLSPGGAGGAGVPGAGDRAFLRQADSLFNHITYDYSGPAVSLDSIFLGNSGGGQTILNQFSGTLTVANNTFSGPLFVGTLGAAVINLSGTSTLNSIGNAEIGLASGDSGTVNQSGGTFTVGSPSPLGFSLFIGRDTGATGTVHLSQPSGATGLTVYGNLHVGFDGSGTFTQDGGTTHLVGPSDGSNGGYLQIATNSGSSGTCTINGGTLGVDGGDVDVGGSAGAAGGTGQFIVNNGTVTIAQQFRIWGPGTATIAGGSVHDTIGTGVSAGGLLTVTGGLLDSPGSAPGLGIVVAAGAAMNITGGAVTCGDFRIDGPVTNSGGTVTIARSIQSPAGTGVYSQSAGTTVFACGTNLQQGLFQITGGDAFTQGCLIPGTLLVGWSTQNLTGNGTLTQSGGTISVGTLGVGNDGTLTGGDGTGHINVSSGTLNADTVILGSSTGGAGDMTVSGSGHVVVGGGFSMNDLTVSGGTLTVLDQNPPPGEDPVLDRSLVAGYLHTGAFNMNAGAVTTPNLKLGVTLGFVGTLAMSGGSLTVGNLLASNGAGSVIQFGGGTLSTGHSEVVGPSAFIIGNGTTGATLNLAPAPGGGGAPGTHSFANGLWVSSTGSLTGSGTVSATIWSFGRVAPGNSAGAMHVLGSWCGTDPGSVLDMQIGGRVAEAEYDRLTVTDTAMLGGTLRLSLINGFVPAREDTFTIMTSGGAMTGSFLNAPSGHRVALAQDTGQAGSFLVTYSDAGRAIVLKDFCPGAPSCPADFDCNAQVQPADVATFVSIWFNSLGTGTPAGDFDGNGRVEPADVASFVSIWFQALSNGC